MRSYHCWFCRETLFTTKKGIAGHERTCHASENRSWRTNLSVSSKSSRHARAALKFSACMPAMTVIRNPKTRLVPSRLVSISLSSIALSSQRSQWCTAPTRPKGARYRLRVSTKKSGCEPTNGR